MPGRRRRGSASSVARLLAGALLLACSCFSPVIHFGEGKSAKEAQHDRLRELTPPVLSQDRRWTAEVRVAKIRVWADDEYRAQNLTWQRGFGEQLEYANAVLEPTFGVRLVAEYQAWEHHAPGSTLAEDLQALAAVDRGDGVLSVVGLTSALGLASATFDELGYASLPGRYIMLRGYADLEERKGFTRAFPDLEADERESALEARRRHKTTAVFLHELGHNLGAPHDEAPDTLMNAIYSEHSAGFTDRTRELVARELDRRLGGGAGAAPVAVPARHLALVIAIATSGEITIDGEPVADVELDAKLKAIYQADHEAELTVELAHGAPRALLVGIFDHAKAVGLKRLSIGIGP